MSERQAIRIRVFDADRRAFEASRDFANVDMLAMSAIETALRAGRSVQCDPIEATAKEESHGR